MPHWTLHDVEALLQELRQHAVCVCAPVCVHAGLTIGFFSNVGALLSATCLNSTLLACHSPYAATHTLHAWGKLLQANSS
jgi:hypothetical protein